MEDLRLMPAKMRQRELIAEARLARLTTLRPQALRDRFGHGAHSTRRQGPSEGMDIRALNTNWGTGSVAR